MFLWKDDMSNDAYDWLPDIEIVLYWILEPTLTFNGRNNGHFKVLCSL